MITLALDAGGSSLRVRGKRVEGHDGLALERLIPARAGKTGWARADLVRAGGSSPRVRGKHVPVVLHLNGLRLIPACAGKTRRR